MSIEDRFNAAVNVIRGLPKNGPYQPSNDMLLTFYSLFKQATKGKCNEGRPAMWNVVSRAKWDAWNRLGEMPKEKAMQKYVDELKKIVETMSYTDNVANFLVYGNGDTDSGVSLNDLEMVAPEAIEKVRSRPNSPIASRDTSPARSSPVPLAVAPPQPLVNGFHSPVPVKPLTNGYHHYQNGGSGTQSDLSDDEYIDTVEDSESESTSFRPIVSGHVSRSRITQNGSSHSAASMDQFHSIGSGSPSLGNPEVAAALARAIDRLNASVQQVNQRINVVEQSVASLRATATQQALTAAIPRHARTNYPPWWPFEEVSPRLLALIILWPLVVGRMTAWLQQRRK